MKEESFQRYGAYYDLLYRDKDYAAESAYIGRILRAAGLLLTDVADLSEVVGPQGS